MSDVRSRAKLSVSALAERKIASARPRKYGLLLQAEEEMLLYGQALSRIQTTSRLQLRQATPLPTPMNLSRPSSNHEQPRFSQTARRQPSNFLGECRRGSRQS